MSDFSDVGLFHKKFGLTTSADGPPTAISPELRDFRLKFLLEELEEICEGYGLELTYDLKPIAPGTQPKQDILKIADGLIDLAYVTLGTAHLHRLPWPTLFAEVQRANVSKERCRIDHRFVQGKDSSNDGCHHPLDESTCCGKVKSAHSLRGSAHDVIKPEGWRMPDIIGVLTKAGWPGPELPLEEK